MSNELTDRIAFGRTAVEEQIEFFVERFGRVDSQWKYDGTRVTEADLNLSKAFEGALSGRFSEDQFLSEEIDSETGAIRLESKYSWLLDPIDGTNNFARAIPACSISLALLEDGVPVYGYVYDHMTQSLIHGGAGLGLRVDDREAGLSDEPPSFQCIVGAQHCEMEETIADDVALQRKFKIRNFGSSAIQLAYTAVGWLDGVIAHRVSSWDIAAGVAMMNEVGGRIVYFGTEPFPVTAFDVRTPTLSYLAGSPAMVDAMLETTGRG